MNEDFICDEQYDEEIFDKVAEMRVIDNWPRVDWFMECEYEEKWTGYYIFNDSEMLDLMRAMPKTTDEIKTIKGFGDKKAEEYGADIIRIINEYRKK